MAHAIIKTAITAAGAMAALYCMDRAPVWRVEGAPMETFIPAANDSLWYCMRHAHLSREAQFAYLHRVLDDSVNQGFAADSFGQAPRYRQGGGFIEGVPIRIPNLMLSGAMRCARTERDRTEDSLERRAAS